MISATRAKAERLFGYQERSSDIKPTLVTIKDLEKLNASCGNCKLRKKEQCTLKRKAIKTYNICTYWKEDGNKS